MLLQWIRRSRVWLLVPAWLLVCAVVRLWPHPGLRDQLPVSRQVLASDGSLLRITLAADGQYRLWVPLETIAPVMLDAIQLKEDRHFHWHPGVNPVSLLRAVRESYLGDNRQGASTITMQLARRWYGLDTRSPAGKLKQIAAALWLELRYSKHDILEAYLNVVPMGGNIEGIGTASRIYFDKPPEAISLVEALALAVLPQDPARRSRFGPALQQARRLLATQWQDTYTTDPQTASLLNLDVHGRPRQQLPFIAPHFTDVMLASHPTQAVIKTTLDRSLQSLLESTVQSYVREHAHQGIHNASALLVDTRDMQVKAVVGSADYYNNSIAGQVNGTRAKRSPGSTLKPFLYGLALDQGLIHPMSILKDSPTAFGPFQPENFDGVFVGPIHARDALIRSRNIPAVALAMQLRHPSLYTFLKHAGISQLKSENHYGLALTLGGGEVTMEELVKLYALLANAGELHDLRYTQTDLFEHGPTLLSPEATFLVLDMLAQNPRPDRHMLLQGNDSERTQARWTTAWKTGTSWGFRDAWTAGISGHYALAVWVGNFDGRGNPSFIGLDTAAPLFFRMVDALPLALPLEGDRRLSPPAGLRRVTVCEASGDLPNRWCPKMAETWFIPGKSPIRVSTLHRPVTIDTRTGRVACPPYDPTNTRTDVFEFWPSDIFEQFRLAGIPRREPPPGESSCLSLTAGDQRDFPVINQPLSGVTYTLRLSRPEETIPLQARTAADVKQLFWFADTTFIGRTSPEETLGWRPQTSGTYQTFAIDDQGRSTSRMLPVEFVP